MSKIDILKEAFDWLRYAGVVKTQKEFAALVGITESNMSRALKGDEKTLTDNLVSKVNAVMKYYGEDSNRSSSKDEAQTDDKDTILVLPTGARAGTLADFADSVSLYDCERIVSPIKGADYAMAVTGDSMAPEYPSGSQIIIKKINENAFVEWGKVYVLDTNNGAIIKQIRKTDDPAVVECVSLNPIYQPFTIEKKYINGWYRVLMVLALK